MNKIFNFIKKEKSLIIKSPLKGEIVELENVPDPVFSEKMTGDGVAIKPVDKFVYAPVNGKVIQSFHHALGIKTNFGLELLLHLGLDTVSLNGEGFTAMVKENQYIKTGDKLFEVDWDLVERKAKSTISPILITNMELVKQIEILSDKNVMVGDDLYKVILAGNN